MLSFKGKTIKANTSKLVSMNTLIIFDVGGVLIKLDFNRAYDEVEKRSGIKKEIIRQQIAKSRIERLRNEGNEQAYFDGMRKILQDNNISEEEINEIIHLALPEASQEMIELKRKLHDAGYAIGILSTLAPATKEYINKNWPEMLESWDGPKQLSYETKILKPEPGAYSPFTKLGFDKIIFIDDKSAYLKHPVEKLGWIGINFIEYKDAKDPMLDVGKEHQDVEDIRGQLYVARTPKEVEIILKKMGLKF